MPVASSDTVTLGLATPEDTALTRVAEKRPPDGPAHDAASFTSATFILKTAVSFRPFAVV